MARDPGRGANPATGQFGQAVQGACVGQQGLYLGLEAADGQLAYI